MSLPRIQSHPVHNIRFIKAVVTIEASLKDTEVGDHASDINSEQGFTWRLHNLAELRDSEDGDTLAKDTDDNFITMQCWMNKDGREVDATGQSLKWTIQLEANIRSDESYIVDWVRLDKMCIRDRNWIGYNIC